MSRRAAPSGDSLDLLLDTICNTFGGILFIAMLVVILTNQMSTESSPAEPTAENSRALRTMRGELSESDARLTKLRQAVRQKEDLERQFADPESRELLTTLHALDDDTTSMITDRNQKLMQVAESQTDLIESARELERLTEMLAEAQLRLEQEKQLLQTETQLRSRTSQTPKQRTTQKTAVAYFLKGGRLCAVAKRDENGTPIPNEDEVRFVDDPVNGKYVEPIENSGLLINLDGSNAAEIEQKLSSFNNDRHYLSVVVNKDSFASFEALKNVIIRMGFEYQLVPFPDGRKAYIGPQTEPALVQ
jgi:hypothetical protein